jgi:ADP-heptose:LPS heptosyltransferase
MKALFRDAEFWLLCEHATARYFTAMSGIARLVEYDVSDRFIFSAAFEKLSHSFQREGFDVCVLFEESPDFSLLYLAGKTGAAIRAGFAHSGSFPFLNVRIKPRNMVEHLSDRSLSLAETFGAARHTPVRWSVSHEALEEIDHLLQSAAASSPHALLCVDTPPLVQAFGERWTRELLEKLKQLSGFFLYAFADGDISDGTRRWIENQQVPLFANRAVTRGAALLARSQVIVAGKSPVFELANLLRRPAVGIFKTADLPRYCRQSALSAAVGFESLPNEQTIRQIAELVAMTANKSSWLSRRIAPESLR